jgi:hypothetical protein
MPLNGSGTASKPSGTTAVSNTTIESSKFNSVIDDIYSIFNTARPIAYGGTGGTSQITGWDGLTAKGTDIASAGTINLTTATGPRVDITGTTTITAVTLAAGSIRIARATGIFQITASANLLVNKSASVNYTTAVGDLLIFIADSTVVSVTAIGSSSTTFSTTTQQLTGTSAVVSSTPDSVAALWEAGSDNTDGATITMGEGGYFNLITSTTAITAFAFSTDKAGRTARVRFDTARTLTHNGTSLIIPGAANITTAQGDIAQVRSLGSGNFVVEWYRRATHSPNGWETIEHVSATGQASYTKTGLSAYRMLRITYLITVATDATNLHLRSDANGGASYDAGASDYAFQWVYGASSSAAGVQSTGATGIRLDTTSIGNATGEYAQGVLTISEFNQAAYMAVIGPAVTVRADGTTMEVGTLSGRRLQATARDAIQIIAASGNISYDILLEGIRG